MKPVKIYTDGACSGNQNEKNTGGWGAVLEYGVHRKEIFGGEKNTTNNRMEMSAFLNAISALKKNGRQIHVFSDSSYLMNCFREKWYIKWQRNNWQTSKKTDVENRDLWERLIVFLQYHEFRFYRVKGHVNTDGEKAALRRLYKKFIEWNGADFTYDEFIYITEMNNRADALAGMGISQTREKASAPEG
jgi:ribonuclease HI